MHPDIFLSLNRWSLFDCYIQRADKPLKLPALFPFNIKTQFLHHLINSKHQAKITQTAAKMAIITNVLTAVNKPSFKSVFIDPPQNRSL
ncbi:hypothetical protein BB987_09955 [Photorhabdus temperata]|uniref:Uncharacterized protein n=1 Tax=Photorhabdus khanii subsp. guanajuatensis TaxID=2100166 RepID=A0A4R4K6D3_9GAMM|nr:hypothetical protein BB987_09955 [Photorhabdus temperata]TDB63094.1 hypothetical protein C5467_00695 [Photorhabdus khanii subsp. guanajuatensis]